MLIGISGKIGSGKDTVGNIIRYITAHKSGGYKYKPNEKEFEEVMEIGFMPVSDAPEYKWEIKKFAGKLKQIVALLTGCTIEDLEDQEFKSQELSEEWWTYKHLYTGTPLEPCLKYSKRPVTDLSPEDFKSLEDTGRITKPTYRLLLQLIGTEAMREVVGENVWVNALFSEYISTGGKLIPVDDKDKYNSKYRTYPNWIITDMRFPNELKAVEERGGITIRINRPIENRYCSACQKPYYQNMRDVRCPICQSMQTSWIKVEPSKHPSETALDNAKFKYVIENDGTIEELIEKIRLILINEGII